VVFGGLTIILKNEMFVKWKPTILFATMAAAIGLAQFVFKTNPIALMFNNQIKAPDEVWRKLSVAWILFLLLVAVLNLVFVYYTSTDTWFLFKTFGDMGMFLVFIIAQVFWLMPYLEEEKPADPALAPGDASNTSKDAAFQEGKT
jgi:intracellular septation protein